MSGSTTLKDSVLNTTGMAIGGRALDADCSQAIDVQADQDACAALLALSLSGDAQGQGCTGIISCISVSGTGNASNTGGDPSCGGVQNGVSVGCVAVSGLGNASNAGNCGIGFVGVGVGCVAGSGAGDAYNVGSCGAGVGAGCVAASGTGGASNACSSHGGVAAGCAAASGTGDATNAGSCGTGLIGLGVGCVAASGTGNASNTTSLCGYGLGGVGVGCVAVSGTGNATNRSSYCGFGDGRGIFGNIGVGVGVGCVAASGLGNASNASYYCAEGFGAGGVGAGCVAVSGTPGALSNAAHKTTLQIHPAGNGRSSARRSQAMRGLRPFDASVLLDVTYGNVTYDSVAYLDFEEVCPCRQRLDRDGFSAS